MIYFLGLACFGIAIATLLWLIIIISCQPRSKKKYPRTSQSQPKRFIREPIEPEEEQVSRAELRLSSLLFFDQKQARRLVDGVKARYPDKPRKWCAEKALSDLERDRQMR